LDGQIRQPIEDLWAAGLKRPRLFSYPYGQANSAIRRAVRDAGFVAGFTTESGKAHAGRDPYRIPRIEILRSDSGWRFLLKLLTASSWPH
jgi:peptidoglycan/xylan/chitin deacetylase (PgdA/CDA1 family)